MEMGAATLAMASERVIMRAPSFVLLLPVSTFSTPEKLLVPFRTSVPQPALVRVAAPPRLALSARTLPGLLRPTVQVWFTPKLMGALRPTFWSAATMSMPPAPSVRVLLPLMDALAPMFRKIKPSTV